MNFEINAFYKIKPCYIGNFIMSSLTSHKEVIGMCLNNNSEFVKFYVIEINNFVLFDRGVFGNSVYQHYFDKI